MLEFTFKSLETHKASIFSIMLTEELSTIALECVLYKTDRSAGEQVVDCFGLRVASKTELKGAESENGTYFLKLSTPEAFQAYGLFLNGTSEDLEAFLKLKLKQTLEGATQ